MRARGWAAAYLGYMGQRLPERGVEGIRRVRAWRASFYHDLVENVDRTGTGGGLRYCSTDQVRFVFPPRRPGIWWDRTHHWRRYRLWLFSEAMRDVDLFVGAHLDRRGPSLDRPR